MKMKKILPFLFIGLLFAACNPMDDIYEEIDSEDITNVAALELTLSSDDYNDMGSPIDENHYFSEQSPLDSFIPDFLEDKYSALTEGSSVKLTYNYKNEAGYLDNYADLSSYTLTADDYATVSEATGTAGYFSPSYAADDYVADILISSVTDAQDGETYIVSYNYSDLDPEEQGSGDKEEIIVFEDGFDDIENFQAISITGDQSWYATSYGDNTFAKMSGYSGEALENEDWLISSAIDLSAYSSCNFNVTQTAKYVNDLWEQMKILISTDYDGSTPSSATWTELTPSSMPTGNDYEFVNTGDMDISSFDGKTVYIAFKYASTTSNAPTWELNDITVKGTTTTKSASIIADAVTLEELYSYTSGENAKWEKTTGVYYLTCLDYDSMGESYGQPGKYNNFSSSILPIDYLPEFAEQKYPYAQEEDTIILVYKYYDSSAKETVKKADKLFFTDSEWKMVIEETGQYILAPAGWVFDPTVNYSMVSEDYQLIVDYVKNNISSDYIDSWGTAEEYYGTSAYYSEFRTTDTYRETSKFDSWEDAATEAIGEVFLPNAYTDAITQVNGIDVYYVITFAAYENSTMVDYTIKFQCTKDGPNPEFTYVEGPVQGTTID